MSLDLSTDHNEQGLAALARRLGGDAFPDYVKSADLASLLEEAPAAAYADQARRTHRVDSKAAAWLAAAYASQWPPAPKVVAAIKRAAAFFGISPDTDRLFDPPAKAAAELPDDAYAYVWVGDDGTKIRQMPVRNPLEAKAAAAYLFEHRDAFGYADRRKVASRVLAKLAAFNAVIADDSLRAFLDRQVGRGAPYAPDVAEGCRKRAHLFRPKDPELAGALEKLAALVEANPADVLAAHNLPELVAALENGDRKHAAAKHYGRGLDRPDEVVYGLTASEANKVAAAIVDWPDGRVFLGCDLEKVSRAEVEAAMGADFAKRACSAFGLDPRLAPVAAQSLGDDDARALSGLIEDAGVRPVGCAGLSPGQLRALAGLPA